MKQELERSLQEFRQKLSRTEQALQESQITENELRRSSEVCEQEQTPHGTKYDNTKCLSLKKKLYVCVHALWSCVSHHAHGGQSKTCRLCTCPPLCGFLGSKSC